MLRGLVAHRPDDLETSNLNLCDIELVAHRPDDLEI